MTQLQTVAQSPISITPIDTTPIVQSESTTAVILAITILISILVSGITGLVWIILVTKSRQ